MLCEALDRVQKRLLDYMHIVDHRGVIEGGRGDEGHFEYLGDEKGGDRECLCYEGKSMEESGGNEKIRNVARSIGLRRKLQSITVFVMEGSLSKQAQPENRQKTHMEKSHDRENYSQREWPEREIPNLDYLNPCLERPMRW